VSDYLFDKQGEPDPEVAQLEQLLRPLAYRGAPLKLPPQRARRIAFSVGVLAAAAAIAATIVLLVAQPWRPTPHDQPPALATPARPAWPALVRGDDATADGQPLTGETQLAVGAWLETGNSHVALRVADAGTVELEPGTRVQIAESSATLHALKLAVGTLSARIDAPARQFVVETPQVTAIDLGCAFKLTVDATGRGRLSVAAGAVALSKAGAPEVVVPAGAECELTEHGPGTPVLARAPRPLPHGKPALKTTVQAAPKSPQTSGPPRPSPAAAPVHAPAAAPAHAPAPPPAHRPASASTPSTRPAPPSKLTHDPFKDLDHAAP